jgi:ribonuclease HII
MLILGVDEVGRGCWAGPLVAAAVLLAKPIKGLNDSKKLTKIQREKLDSIIRKKAIVLGLGWVDAVTLDKVGVTAATRMAMERAVAQIDASFDEVIIDGNINYLANFYKDNPCSGLVVKTLVGADATVPSVSAASIIAKVARDKFMAGQALKYPDYGFDKHVGYGTKLHQEMLKLYGICELHRRSYKPIKQILEAAAG